ncbi:MAG: hypothetical protein U0Y10_11070 [Spirosomataceae bacterium]
METPSIPIPKILIYEEFDGHPIYRKRYKDVLLGLKTVEEINMGTSALQFFIIACLVKRLNKILPDSYFAGSAALGLHLAQGTNFAADIAIYKTGQLKVGFSSTKYTQVPPNVIVEVDIKIDESEYFQNEEEYFHKKTERLLKWGVEKVVWVLSASRRILIADNLQKWEFISWDLPFTVIDNHEINLWELMLSSGFEPEL